MAAEVHLRKNKQISPAIHRVVMNAVEVFFRIITRHTTHRGSDGLVGGLVIRSSDPSSDGTTGYRSLTVIKRADKIVGPRHPSTRFRRRTPASTRPEL
jgi:hypothetical protein